MQIAQSTLQIKISICLEINLNEITLLLTISFTSSKVYRFLKFANVTVDTPEKVVEE